MAMRFASSGSRLGFLPMMERASRGGRYFSEMKGKVLSEEERAAENVYIQKMERERMEKLKQKAEKEKHSEQEKEEKKLEALLKRKEITVVI
ncbi:unnamed protein product [Victoria cruziana]